jgi:hypothetical protein
MKPSALLRVPESRAFVSVGKAKEMLASARTLLEAKRVKDIAEAMRVWARAQREGLFAAQDAAEIVLRSERRLGKLDEKLEATPPKERNAKIRYSQNTKSQERKKLGFTKGQVQRFRRTASLSDDAFEAVIAAARKEAREVTSRDVVRVANGGRVNAKFSSESVEWYTPAKYIEAARHALGEIDLDPASSPKANEIVKAKKILTQRDNGLKREWHGRVWLNPPYALVDGESSAGLWGVKLIEEWEAKRVEAAVLLVNATTDAKWFQPFWRFAICFTDHRIEFYTPNGQPRSPVAGNAFVYLGDRPKDFARAFDEFGVTVARLS